MSEAPDTSRKAVHLLAIDFDTAVEISCFLSNAKYRQAAATLRALLARAEKAEAALLPFAFVDSKTTQDAWDIRNGDRFRDWIDFDDILAARVVLNKTP